MPRAAAAASDLFDEDLGAVAAALDTAHWTTFLVSAFSDGMPMHPGCRQVTALLA